VIWQVTVAAQATVTCLRCLREKSTLQKLIRWLPAVLLMAVIFVFSSIPSN
jgi:hypothetical protein